VFAVFEIGNPFPYNDVFCDREPQLSSESIVEESNAYDQEEAFRLYQEGYERQVKGDLKNAIDLYKKSLEVCPTAEAHTFLGWAYSFQGRYQEAIQECHKAIEVDPEFGNPYNDIGAYLIEQQKYDEALPWLGKAVHAKRYETYCYPYYNMGRVWEQKGNWQKALEYYTRALDDNPDYTLAERAVKRLQGWMN